MYTTMEAATAIRLGSPRGAEVIALGFDADQHKQASVPVRPVKRSGAATSACLVAATLPKRALAELATLDRLLPATSALMVRLSGRSTGSAIQPISSFPTGTPPPRCPVNSPRFGSEPSFLSLK